MTPASEHDPIDDRRLAEHAALLADQAAADVDQDAADTDQSASDADRAASERDDADASRDQRSADRDQANADERHAGWSADEADDAYAAGRAARLASRISRLTTHGRRADTARGRDVTARGRDGTASQRDDTARRREELALHGEEEIASSGDSLRMKFERLRERAAKDRARAAADRARAAADRTEAAAVRARLEAELHSAYLDDLTGAFRRELGWLALELEIDRSRRGDGRFVLVFIDVDDLKGVNDRAGHAAGDNVLKALVAAMRANLRSFDPIVRFGGDEFVCGIAGTGLDEAARRFDLIRNSLLDDTGVGISFGLALLAEGETLEEIMARADALLLSAKRSRDA